jgi:hypothetical protein
MVVYTAEPGAGRSLPDTHRLAPVSGPELGLIRLWCKLKLKGSSVGLRLASGCELGSSGERRVPQFRHRRIAPAELARLELPLLDLLR